MPKGLVDDSVRLRLRRARRRGPVVGMPRSVGEAVPSTPFRLPVDGGRSASVTSSGSLGEGVEGASGDIKVPERSR